MCNLLKSYSNLIKKQTVDFGFMKKPAVYYQFDKEYFFRNHYKKGYFSYEHDSFGYLVDNMDSVIKSLRKIVNSGFVFENRFLGNHKRFFKKYDNKNCERIYVAIMKL